MSISQIACLGPEGTFSHLLAAQRFGAGASIQPCDSLPQVFAVLAEDKNSLAVVPIENSSGGTITETIDLLIQHQSQIEVREDLTLDVRLALLGHRNKPIREIFSHFAPLSHHREWLRQQFPAARLVPVASTAVAARQAAARPTRAALASPGVAQLLPLEVLQFPIRADEVNVTRFYVLSPRGCGKVPRVNGPKKTAMDKTALVVQLKNECGSLHAFLGVFARKQINLRLIVSRPVPGHPETYVFYLEVEGHALCAPLEQALRLARRHCLSLESLGTFQVGRRFRS
jgi:prephenate dehydratase